MSNKDYFGQSQQPQQYYPPPGTFLMVFTAMLLKRVRVALRATAWSGWLLPWASAASAGLPGLSWAAWTAWLSTTPATSSRIRVRLISLPAARVPTSTVLRFLVSSPHPRRIMTSSRRAWPVSACVVVLKVRGCYVSNLTCVMTLPSRSEEICACIF